jgi:small subunit ribosomal protein S8
MMTDPISDFLTRLRNGHMAGRKGVNARFSKMTVRLAHILKDNGFIEDYAERLEDGKRSLWVSLRYTDRGEKAIEGVRRVSKPGLRIYSNCESLPVTRNGLGLAIVSTSKGIMAATEAKKLGVGGEVICELW